MCFNVAFAFANQTNQFTCVSLFQFAFQLDSIGLNVHYNYYNLFLFVCSLYLNSSLCRMDTIHIYIHTECVQCTDFANQHS